MNLDQSILNDTERAAFSLRALYQSRGFLPYKMSKFEPYELYVRNKDFLVSDHVITFTDTNGRLMALKPDVTLSIIKNGRDVAGSVEKVYYHENVYRISRGTHAYKEIPQAGIECVGDVGEYDVLQVVALAVESLRTITDRGVLDLSHLGIVSAVLEGAGLSDEGKKDVLAFLGEKNLHGALDVCKREGVSMQYTEHVRTLLSTYGAPERVLPLLRTLPEEAMPALAELERLVEALSRLDLCETVRVDFSVVNDMGYYNGVVFRGFVDGIPTGLLSGGQYDELMKKMGRKAKAIGFAVYLDLLEELSEDSLYDVDTVLLYGEDDEPADVAKALRTLSETASVTALRTLPAKLKYRTCISLKEVEDRG